MPPLYVPGSIGSPGSPSLILWFSIKYIIGCKLICFPLFISVGSKHHHTPRTVSGICWSSQANCWIRKHTACWSVHYWYIKIHQCTFCCWQSLPDILSSPEDPCENQGMVVNVFSYNMSHYMKQIHQDCSSKYMQVKVFLQTQ